MLLKEINKAIYRKRLNIVIALFIICLTAISISLGAILIHLFGEALPAIDPVTGEALSNFRYNFVGVILALLICISILQQLKSHPFCKEIHYVWVLKQIQNIIYRRLKNIKAAANNYEKEPDINAFVILNFYYKSLIQVYMLDNNTLTISTVKQDLASLEARMAELNIDVTKHEFNRVLLIEYR